MGNAHGRSAKAATSKAGATLAEQGKGAFMQSTQSSDVDVAKQLAQLKLSEDPPSAEASKSKSKGKGTGKGDKGKKSKTKGFQVKMSKTVNVEAEKQKDRTQESGTESEAGTMASAYPSQKWTPAQDAELRSAVREFEGKNWKSIAQLVHGKTHVQCLQRWKKVLQPGLVKGHWTEREDAVLSSMVLPIVAAGGPVSWVSVAKHIPGRTAKQCRERWSLNLDPSINRTPWTPAEDASLLELHAEHGNRWADISGHLQGRTENAVKTRFKSLLRKKEKAFTAEEDFILLQGKADGLKYGLIAEKLPNRSKNSLKTRWKQLVEERPEVEGVVRDASMLATPPYLSPSPSPSATPSSPVPSSPGSTFEHVEHGEHGGGRGTAAAGALPAFPRSGSDSSGGSGAESSPFLARQRQELDEMHFSANWNAQSQTQEHGFAPPSPLVGAEPLVVPPLQVPADVPVPLPVPERVHVQRQNAPVAGQSTQAPMRAQGAGSVLKREAQSDLGFELADIGFVADDAFLAGAAAAAANTSTGGADFMGDLDLVSPAGPLGPGQPAQALYAVPNAGTFDTEPMPYLQPNEHAHQASQSQSQGQGQGQMPAPFYTVTEQQLQHQQHQQYQQQQQQPVWDPSKATERLPRTVPMPASQDGPMDLGVGGTGKRESFLSENLFATGVSTGSLTLPMQDDGDAIFIA